MRQERDVLSQMVRVLKVGRRKLDPSLKAPPPLFPSKFDCVKKCNDAFNLNLFWCFFSELALPLHQGAAGRPERGVWPSVSKPDPGFKVESTAAGFNFKFDC